MRQAVDLFDRDQKPYQCFILRTARTGKNQGAVRGYNLGKERMLHVCIDQRLGDEKKT